MGEVRSGTGRSGAQALPLTRRQQKRARQQPARQLQARQQIQQRRTQPPQAPLQAAAPERPAPTPTAAALAAGSPASVPAPARSGASTAKGQRASGIAPKAAPERESAAASVKTPPRRVKSGAPAPSRARSAGAARAVKSAKSPLSATTTSFDAPGSSGRKYPTLARMVAVVPPKDQETSPAAVAEESNAASSSREAAHPHEPHPESLETRPVPIPALASATRASPRRAVPTRRLAPADDGDSPWPHHEPDPHGAGESAPKIASGERPLPIPFPLPEPDLVVPIAAVHAGLAAVAALTGAGLLITGVGYALWPLSLAAIVGAGGWLASLVPETSRRLAACLLLFAQLGLLAWLLALLGARGAILALVPALALLALRWLDRAAAYAVAFLALVLYAAAALLQLNGVTLSPLALSSAGAALLDGGLVAAGLLATLLLAGGMHHARLRAERLARARQHELRTLRARLTQTRAQVEDDAARLEDALARALTGRRLAAPVETDGLLSPLAETANAAAERLALLQRDREERLRLESAVRTVTQAVERAWLGLPWSWPAWSGTALDELVSLLRAPRPQETRADWSDGTPTLSAIPAIERVSAGTGERAMTPRPWERSTPISLPLAAIRSIPARSATGHANGHSNGNDNDHAPDQTPPSLPARGSTEPSALLPWKDWDTWAEWRVASDE